MEQGKGYRSDYTFDELIFKIFKSKKCPFCGVKLSNSKTYVQNGTMKLGVTASSRRTVKKVDVTDIYTCVKCGKGFTIKELINLSH